MSDFDFELEEITGRADLPPRPKKKKKSSSARESSFEIKPDGYYTTGQVAKLLKVAPRTVSKWFDSGRLGGQRLPGSQDRRIPHNALLEFTRAHYADVYEFLIGGARNTFGVIWVGHPNDAREVGNCLRDREAMSIVSSGFELGVAVCTASVQAVVLDTGMIGTNFAERLAAMLDQEYHLKVFATWGQEDSGPNRAHFIETFRKPLDPPIVANRIETHVLGS